MAGFRLTTKVQVSGWRFLLRRLENAIVRRDTRMFDDPLSFYSRSAGAGVVVAVLILVGCLALAYFKPQGKLDGDLFIDSATKQLFVKVSERIHPVYNLTSGRLVLGKPADPVTVKSTEVGRSARGQSVGIPGAPYATPVVADKSPVWALCDTVIGADSANPAVQTAAVSMPLDVGRGDPMLTEEMLLTTYEGQTWAITRNGRHAIDLADRALTLALAIPANVRPSPISEAMFNAVPDAGPWRLPPIPGAGDPNAVGLPPELVIGSVFQIDNGVGNQFFVVLPDGVAPVNPNTASLLRANESYGMVAIPSIVKSQVAKIPEREYPSPLPDEPIKFVSRSKEPVLCWKWQRIAGEQGPTTTLLAMAHLPIPPASMELGIRQVRGPITIYIDGGKFVQIQSPDPRYGEALYYVDPQGVRYGVPDQKTADSLGLSAPTAAPWWVIRLLVDGPVLSREAALLEHDTLGADPNPRKLPATSEGSG